MASYLTSADLIASVKRRASIPESQNTFTDADFLALANEELAIGLVPSILQYHEEYFVASETVTLLPSVANYPIPSRAIGNRLRQLSYLDTQGNEFEMTRIQPENLYDLQRATSVNGIYRFYVKGTDIVLVPGPTIMVSGQIKFTFFLRPNQLVLSNRAAIIKAIDRTTGNVLVDQIPSNFNLGIEFDLVRTSSPHNILDYDQTAVTISTSTKTIQFDPTILPSGLSVGDAIMQAEETIIPNVPTDLHVVLAHRVATRCLESLGDQVGLQMANAKLSEMETKTGNLIDDRVEGSPQKIVNRNGLLRLGKIARRRNWL